MSTTETSGDLCSHDLLEEDCKTCTEGGIVSDPDDTMDQMIQRASVPNLATLFQRGKDAGLLKPTTNYGENA